MNSISYEAKTGMEQRKGVTAGAARPGDAVPAADVSGKAEDRRSHPPQPGDGVPRCERLLR
jgi:hypothetical protein